jgi:hypothetical protein
MMSYVIGKGGRRMRGRRLQAFLKEVTVSLERR